MNLYKYFPSLKSFTAVLSPLIVIISSLVTQLPTYSLEFPSTTNRGAPARTAGGGVRGDSCTEKGVPLTALVPNNNIGTTVAANPTFFWYVPESSAQSAEFVVLDNEGNEVYLKTFALPRTSGVVKLALPQTASLAINKNYRWEFAVICNPQDRTQDQVIQGLIQRSEPDSDLKTKLEKASPLEQAELYAKAKIWQETLTLAAQLRSSHPDTWEGLLKSVGLDAIAKKPLIDCCKVED